MLSDVAQVPGEEDDMENAILIIVLLAVFAVGWFAVDRFGRSMDAACRRPRTEQDANSKPKLIWTNDSHTAEASGRFRSRPRRGAGGLFVSEASQLLGRFSSDSAQEDRKIQ